MQSKISCGLGVTGWFLLGYISLISCWDHQIFIKLSFSSILKSACEFCVEVLNRMLTFVLFVFACSESPNPEGSIGVHRGTLRALEFKSPNTEGF